MYLLKDNLLPATNFINSPLWADIKRCLREREPKSADRTDLPHTAAAAGFERKGFEFAIEQIEFLPRDIEVKATDPFDRPAINEIKD